MTGQEYAWNAPISVSKAYQDEQGKMHVVAVASDDTVDLQRDQMTDEALDKMASQVASGIPLLDNHKATFEFGRTCNGYVQTGTAPDGKPARQLFVDVELDGEYPEARSLYKEVLAGKCKKQLSIGGKLNTKNRNAAAVEMTAKGLVRKLKDLELDHIACTRPAGAANPNTGFVEAIMKSLDEEDALAPLEQEAQELFEKTIEETEEIAKGKDVDDAEVAVSFLSRIGRKLRGKGANVMGSTVNKQEEFDELVEEEEETTTPVENGEMDEDMSGASSPGDEEEYVTDDELAAQMEEAGDEMNFEEVDMAVDPDQEYYEEDIDSDLMEDQSENAGAEAAAANEDMAAMAVEEEAAPADELPPEEGEEDVEIDVEAGGDEYLEEDSEEYMDELTPEEEEAAKSLMAKRRSKRLAKAKSQPSRRSDLDDAEDVLREIALLLRKSAFAKSIKKRRQNEREAVPAIRTALHDVRYLLAKQAMDDGITGAVGALASEVVEGGAYAPREGAGPKGEKDDKASGETAIGDEGVTDARNQPVYGEAAGGVDAPTGDVKTQFEETLTGISQLPQTSETAEFGKSLEKSKQETLQQTSDMLLKAVESITQSTQAQNEQLMKAIQEQNARIERLEGMGGVSQGGPRGTKDDILNKSKKDVGGGDGSVWGGLLTGASKQATSHY